MKKVSLIIFLFFYIMSFITSNIPYPEYAKNPILSFMVSLLTIVSFLFVTWNFANSKKFLITISIYFICILVTSIIVIYIGGLGFSWMVLPFYIIIFSLATPITHFERMIIYLLDILSIELPDGYLLCIEILFIACATYLIYFISRKRLLKVKN
ncbi:MAG: hypothetical protein IJ333_07905 [Clostridia bacterium]|nr:hypothetical protein [Clostridia bacterium]